jgi:hypothetical protein
MRLPLNGWQRLWVVISIIYILPVLSIAALAWPTPEATSHQDAFISQLPADIRAQIDGAYRNEYDWKEAWKRRADSFQPDPRSRAKPTKTASDRRLPPLTGDIERDFGGLAALTRDLTDLPGPAHFPNGAVLDIRVAKKGDDQPDARVAQAYWTIVEGETRRARWALVVGAALWWLIPSLALYALGWSVAWVRRGFRPDR